MKTLKRIFILTVTLIITIINISAVNTSALYAPDLSNVLDQKYIENENYTYYINTDYSKAVIIDIKSGTEIFNVPETVTYNNATYPIASISISHQEGYSDFNKSLKVINASKNLEEIDISLFIGYSSNPHKLDYLKTINIPNNSKLTDISLPLCPALKNINLTSNSKLENINVLSCTKMTKLSLPKTLKQLNLQNAPKLKVKIAKDNKKFKVKGNQILSKNGKTLYQCVGNSKTVHIYKTVKKINKINNSYIKNLNLGKNIKAIKGESISNCKRLSKVTLKSTKNAPKIENNAFKNTKKGIKFYVKNKKVAKSLKKQLKGSGVKKAKILVGKKVVYKNVK